MVGDLMTDYMSQIDDLLDAFATDPEVENEEYYRGLFDLHKRIGETLRLRRPVQP